jgi:SP family general alpha glucoside:H+ symporter-like MFS transporter
MTSKQEEVVEDRRPSYGLQPTDTAFRKMSVYNPDLPQLLQEAKEATNAEKSMTLREAFRTYPKAVMFSVILSTAIIMEGYDVVLLANLYAFPTFAKRYGTATGDPTTPYQISAPWQAGLSNGANVGEILGLFINGIVSERYGYRKTMITSLVAVAGFIFIPFFAKNLIDLEIGEVLCGIPWGVFQTLTTAYASEVCPTQLRAYLTTYVNLCWVIGQLIGAGVLRSMLNRTDQWSYRIPFVSTSVDIFDLKLTHIHRQFNGYGQSPLSSEYSWLPSHPGKHVSKPLKAATNLSRWLIRRGRVEDAKTALRKLTSSKNAESSFSVDETIAMMVTTNELEKAIESGTNYWDCFKGIDLRRTEIVCVTWSIQNLCGSAFMGYSTYFYEQAGLPTVDAFDLSMAQVNYPHTSFALSYCG